MVAALSLGTWTGPLAVLALVVATSLIACVARRLLAAVAVSLPVFASILLINTFLFPGAADPIVRLGPLAPTWSGLAFGLATAARLLAVSLALALVYLTTDTADLVNELERRGLGRRAGFVINATLGSVPRLVSRAREIVDAQRARGLDTEGGLRRRVRGVLPLVSPLVFSALSDVEQQTLALESRAFSAPVRRTPLRTLPDSAPQRALRWLLLLGVLAIAAAGLSGAVRVP